MSTPWNPDAYAKAWDFASDYHRGQTYGGPKQGTQVSYIYHLGGVAMEVMWAMNCSSLKWDADLAIQCALLHDVLEDTACSYHEVEVTFGKVVAQGVQALTKNPTICKADRMLDSLSRIKQQPEEIWVVKIADRICNLHRPPSFWGLDELKRYREESQLIHHELKPCHPEQSMRLAKKIVDYENFSLELQQVV